MQHSHTDVPTQEPVSQHETSITPSAQCPVDHSAWSWQKTAQQLKTTAPMYAPIECDAEGIWHVRSFDAVRTVLRSADTRQAGFNAELIERAPGDMNRPILYLEGKQHQQQRKLSARFFTPKMVNDSYRRMMERLSDQLIKKLKRQKQADLSQLSMILAVRVAGQVVGLTNSFPGITGRLDAFFEGDFSEFGWSPRTLLRMLKNQSRMFAFFYLDVLPAIRARRRAPKEDVISHLLAQKYSDLEILTECVTYGAAGMVTTREFISVAAWHMLERPELRQRYLAATEEERYAILHEILRLEPVVTRLSRRATAAIKLESNGEHVTIPPGAKIHLYIDDANMDTEIAGELPLALCPGRQIKGERIPEMLMSFGDGAHRCPGAFIAIQETDIFLQRLLAIDSLRIVSKPSMSWGELSTGYELRHFVIAVERN